MAKSNKECWKIYREMQFMLDDEEYDKGLSRKFDDKWDTEEAINILDNRLYHKVAISSKKKCNNSNVK